MSLQINQITNHLEKNYFQHLDLSDLPKEINDDELKKRKKTRSLAAIAINILTDADEESAAEAVTDGYHDKGLDAIFYNKHEKCLYLIQSKFNSSGNGSISLGDTEKYIKGVKKIIEPNFEGFNKKIKERKSEINDILMDPQNKFILVVVHSGKDPMSTECKSSIDDFLDENNEISEQFFFKELNIKDIYQFISTGATSKPIDQDVLLYNWAHISEPISAFYGQVAGSDLAEWYSQSGPHLFSPNIRVYLGNTEVNEGITETVQNNPEHFWYFNNGITALCGSITKSAIGGNDRGTGYFSCKNIKIVNGAQTVGTLSSALKKFPEELERVRVWIRLIEVSDHEYSDPEDKEQISRRITQTNNTQNRIEKRDFVALDPQQKRIHDQLAVNRISYLYRAGETAASDDFEDSIDLTQATIALACYKENVDFSTQSKREISKLWEDIYKSPYTEFFNKGTDPVALYRKVKILQEVDKFIQKHKKSLSDRDKLVITHGNRFILHLIFQRLGEQIINADSYEADVLEAAELMFNATSHAVSELYPSAYCGSLFKNAAKCRKLKEVISIT